MAKPQAENSRLLDAYSAAVTRAVSVAAPAVVSVRTLGSPTRSARSGRSVSPYSGMGSGVIIDSSGHVITNHHVIVGAVEIEVALADGRRFAATVAGKDAEHDLALLRSEIGDVQPAHLADSDELQIGQIAIAIGNPLGLECTVTTGVISARDRRLGGPRGLIAGLIQTDSSINPGNSGGPLVNSHGEVVGINTAHIAGAQGLGFAVPSNRVRAFLVRWLGGGSGSRAWLGVSGVPQILEDGTKGVLLLHVFETGPAAQAGVRTLDVICSAGGDPVGTQEDLMRILERLAPGEGLFMEIDRAGERRTLTVETGEAS